jgi:hypothetical protein
MLVLLVVMALISIGDQTRAAPSVTLKVAEGYLVLFEEDGTPHPGPVSTRFGISLGWKVHPSWIVNAEVGVAISNTVFEPAPRVILGVTYLIDERWSFGGGLLYQPNPPYGGRSITHLIGPGLGPAYCLDGKFLFGLSFGASKLLKGSPTEYWSILVQPWVGVKF